MSLAHFLQKNKRNALNYSLLNTRSLAKYNYLCNYREHKGF